MTLIAWHDRLLVGVKSIDEQHLSLVNAVNALHSSISTAGSSGQSVELLAQLAEYTQFHFHSEEELMQSQVYPSYALHKRHHDVLLMQVNQFLERSQQGEQLLNGFLMNYLRDWLSAHILEDDLELGAWLVRNSKKAADAPSQPQQSL